ncbi:myoferlin-like [Malaya genurostris]|uniref:myoferlin-like n=1 Tax=Malaya genurostris TaxID=325434 RepID=UPI0026F3C98F|nr:myoferlin-like [Malaya genurostris]
MSCRVTILLMISWNLGNCNLALYLNVITLSEIFLGHAFLHKWAVLENQCAASSGEGHGGFLQMDISIVSRYQRSIPIEFPTVDSDIIENNLLAPLTDHQSLQRVQYSINIFRGDFTMKADYEIQVSFGGIMDILTSTIGHLKSTCEKASTPDELRTIRGGFVSLLENLKELTHDAQNTFPECLLFIGPSKGRGSYNQKTAKGCIRSCNKTNFDALCRLNTIDYMHNSVTMSNADANETTGMVWAKRCSILVRSSSCHHSCDPEWCGCIYAKLDAAICVGSERDVAEWDKQRKFSLIHSDNNNEELQCRQSALPIKCQINVHQGKIQAGCNASGLCEPKLVVLFENYEMTTSTIPQTLAPLWNEIIEFRNIRITEHCSDSQPHPFKVIFVLLDKNKQKCSQKSNEIIGIGWADCTLRGDSSSTSDNTGANKNIHFHPVTTPLSTKDQSVLDDTIHSVKVTATGKEILVESPGQRPLEALNKFQRKKCRKNSAADLWEGFNDRRDYVLRWIGVFREGQRTANVLMSIQLTQMMQCDEKIVSAKLIQGIPKKLFPEMNQFNVEVLFGGLRGFSSSKTMPGNFQIQIVIGELILVSGLSSRSFGKSINFLDSYAKGSLMLPSKLEYWPPMIVRLIDCSKSKVDRVLCSNIIETSNSFLLKENWQSIQHYLIGSTGVHYDIGTTYLDTFPEEYPLIEKNQRKSNLTNTIKPTLRTIKGIVQNKLKFAAENMKSSMNTAFRRDSHETEYTWWTKFYNSCSSHPADYKAKLKIYPCELEKIPAFEQFQDWSMSMKLFKKTSQNPLKINEPYCNLKCKVWITPSNGDSKQVLQNPLSNIHLRSMPAVVTETQVMVIAYIVQGVNLRSRDIFSLSDAYIKLEYGKEKAIDRPNYVKNQSNPVFGRRFMLTGRLPRDQFLKISIMDRDTCSADDLIGSTVIDIEDRFRSRHFMSLGIPQEFNSTGYNSWRHPLTPSLLLEHICSRNGMMGPQYVGNIVQLAGVTFHDESTSATTEDLRERLALAVLNNFNRIPILGCHIVPEHVETRSLFHSDQPGIEQGKLQMWLEICPAGNLPTLVDITPNPPKPYELRVIVWNTLDVILDEKNMFGTKMSDIYVKCWLQDVTESQLTDIHYRSLDGEGNFNWRMVFSLNYSSAETMMVVTRKKSFYEQLDTEEKVPPVLTVQLWDNDLFSRDDFLGTLSLNLAHLPRPVSNPRKCIIVPAVTAKQQYINLFRVDTVRGWFPIVGKADNKIIQTGKIELELKILTEEEALSSPAGKGRKPPQPLPMPDRPDASFNWYRNPLKSFRLILWPQARKALIIGSILALIALICYVVISALPAAIVTKAFSRKASLDRTILTGADGE